ncbi:MAG TPA: response regulator [Desulfurivibrionaceae bacterium]|nr:response regulator [Desulfurivibrionaceae bacterium]
MAMIPVLIIDDEHDFAVTLAERLQLRNFEAKAVGSADEAMALLQDGWRPAVVIVDLKMPGLDGIETLSLIKQHDSTIEVILLTGHGSTNAGIEGMNKGLFDYLMKPVDIGELVEKIELAAGSH